MGEYFNSKDNNEKFHNFKIHLYFDYLLLSSSEYCEHLFLSYNFIRILRNLQIFIIHTF